jgi:hypothetical protein
VPVDLSINRIEFTYKDIVMPEKINFLIFFDRVDKIPSKEETIDLLFRMTSPWLQTPGEYMLLNWDNGQEKRGFWNDSNTITSNRLDDNTLLFVYDAVSSPDVSLDCISVEEGGENILYTISLDLRKLREKPLIYINDWLISLYMQLQIFCNVIIAGGSEIELKESVGNITSEDFVEFSLSLFANCSWILLPTFLAPKNPDRFGTIEPNNDFVLLYDKGLNLI